MDPDPTSLLIFAISLVVLWFAVAIELALTITERSDIREMSENGDSRASSAEKLLQDPERLLVTSVMLKTAGIAAASAAVIRMQTAEAPFGQFLLLIVAIGVIAVFVRILARASAARWPHTISLRCAGIMQALSVILWPAYVLVRKIGSWMGADSVRDIDENVFLSEEAIRLLIDVSDEDPILESEKQMIASILEMDETITREVMVPRIDVVALDVNTSLRDALDVIIDAGHSRLPVYEKNIDQIIGFLYAKDLLRCFQENRDDIPISTLLRPVYFIPETKKVNALMAEMQKRHVHVSMVVDEYGGTAGLVTIEDLLEEIVGEIQDEYDEEEDIFVETLDDGRYIINARYDLYSVGELLNMDLSEEDADTLGGLLYSFMGHVPEQGESVVIDGWRFTVLSLEGRRIDEVRADPAGVLVPEPVQVSEEIAAENHEYNYT